jgi:hypothetical protein
MTVTTLQAAMDDAASIKGLKGRARRNAEIERSDALQIERIRCSGLTESELSARLAARLSGRLLTGAYLNLHRIRTNQ